MNPLILGPIMEMGKMLLDKFGPEDKTEKARMEADFIKMAAEGELKKVIAQLEINAKEAAHPSVWVSGWRPAYGWFGGIGFLYAVFLHPILSWLSLAYGLPQPPEINVELLLVVMGGMLGIGGLRTYEKKAGVTK